MMREGGRINRYPFSAIVGQPLLKRSLIYNAVDGTIGGVLIFGQRGTAKSTAVRALADLLPEQDVVEGCPFGCDPKDPDHKVDNWLWKIVYLPGLYSKKNFLRKAVSLEAEAAVRDLQLEDAGSYSDTEKTLLYLEFRNAAKRYLSTTKSDRYGSKLLGLKKAGPEDKAKKAAEDIWRASKGLAVASGETERLEIWCAALRDELIQFDKSCESYYDELDRRNQK